MVRKMMRKFPLTSEVKSQIRLEVQSTAQLAERAWLLQQLEG
jgi:hypothetical protein